MRKIVVALGMLVFLAGCTVHPDEKTLALQQEFQNTIPVCMDKADCEMKWSAARQWVLANAGFKIQTMTDDYIETYNAINSSTYLAARVIKEPLGDGTYRITVAVWCDNWIGCNPPKWQAAVDFNRTVNAAKAQ